MSKWKKALGLGDKKVEQSLAEPSMDNADLSLLVEPSAEQPMVGHAQQHSALTRLANETNTELVEVGATVDRNTADIDDISEFLGAVYFEVSLGKERWTFDTPEVPQEGNFTAFSYEFSQENNHFWINEIPSGNEVTGFDSARPGDKMHISSQTNPKTDFGNYIVTSISLDNNKVWDVEGDWVIGNGRLNAGQNYEIEIIHVSQQFEKKRKGETQIASTDYVDAGDEAVREYAELLLASNGVGGENHSGEISDLTKRVDNNSDNILELRNNDEYLNNKIDNYYLPKFYPSGKRNYTTTHSISNLERSDSGSNPWFVTAESHTNGTGNTWPGNANAIHLYYDADQHDKVATGAGTILIFDKDDNKIMMHAVVTGTPLKQKISDKDCWSFEIVLIEALGRQWDYTSEYEMTLSGVFWAA